MNIQEVLNRLDRMATAELCAEFEQLFGRQPRYRSPQWMRKRIAHRVQENAYGGLSRTALAELERLAGEIEIPEVSARRNVADRGAKGAGKSGLKPGTMLQREWRGQQIQVQVLPDGFAWNDEVFGSLSAVAKAVTGQHWSGPRFFGLTRRAR